MKRFLKRLCRSSLCSYSTITNNISTSSLVEVFVDDKAIKIPNNSVVIQACAVAGMTIPRFCYHERLAIAGNCRMCLVQIDKQPKLAVSCALPVQAGMHIYTDTPLVRKGREGVMEFLLANHPLDCVVCDQGGECDLQDQSLHYGSDRSRFVHLGLEKRAVADKHFGPLVKTSMNRCIHCTRCVRFANDLAGMTELGSYGRGNTMEIGTYIQKLLDNPLSGNIIDLCPVGALTAKPYAFSYRSWELKKTFSVDALDAVGASIRIDTLGPRVMRVLPAINDSVNEEWLSDKSRFACDGLNVQRLMKPSLYNDSSAGQDSLQEITWMEALSTISSHIQSTNGKLTIVAGDFCDIETLAVAKNLLQHLSFKDDNIGWQERMLIDEQLQTDMPYMGTTKTFLGGLTLEQLESHPFKRIFLVGTDPMKEATLLAMRLRKAWLSRDLNIYYVGKPPKFLPFEYEHIKEQIQLKHFELNKDSDLVLYGDYWLAKYGPLDHFRNATMGTVLRHAGRAGALALGYGVNSKRVRQVIEDSGVVLLLGTDQLPRNAFDGSKNQLIVYVGSHGDVGAEQSYILLPGSAYTEREGATFINVEGRVQRTRRAVAPPGDAREDWRILAALAEVCGHPLIQDEKDLRVLISKEHPDFLNCNALLKPSIMTAEDFTAKFSDYADKPSIISDYYITDSISRASATMAKCSQEFLHQNRSS